MRTRLRRLGSSVPAALQITVGATAAYCVAHFLLGHATPLLAVTVTISSLGFARDARPRRILETAVGILIGIALSEALLLTIGRGVWQLIVVLLLTLLVARFFSPNAAFAGAAATQSMLVLLLPLPEGGPFVRSIDGLIGGAFALIVTALIPRDPRGAARRDSRRLFSTIDESLASVVVALDRADEPAAELALQRLRRTQQIVDDWTASLDSAISIARISPFLRRHLPDLREQGRVLTGLDLATRHLRVITRRIDFVVRDGAPRPELAELVSQTAAGIRMLRSDTAATADTVSISTMGDSDASTRFAAVARRLDPAALVPDAAVTDAVLVLLMRPLLVDLLVAAGRTAAEARAELPPV